MTRKSVSIFLLVSSFIYASAADGASRIRPVLLHSIKWNAEVFTLLLDIQLCRDFNPKDFEVRVRQERNNQRIRIVDQVGVDCRAVRIQEIKLHTTAIRDDKPIYLANPLLVDYDIEISMQSDK